ncbi:zinc finger, CCHC-type containing protein, partial [Tanacetum coccineum]
KMDNPDTTMEEYVQYETEKALRNGKVYNWESAKYESDFSSKPALNSELINNVNLENKTSLPEHDYEEYNFKAERKALKKRFSKKEKINILNIGEDLLSYEITFADNLQLDKGNDDDKIGVKQFSRDIFVDTYVDENRKTNALPPKEKDLGSFTLPCTINNICFDKALADLGASVSVMPNSTFTNLGLGKLAPTKLIIELADRIMKCPKGLAENMLVGIDKFFFPIDFIVLDMLEDSKTLLILGRPFLSTTHAKIDVFKRKIALKFRNDKIVFKNLEARIMGEALILNRSEDPDFGDFIELNDLNEPLELRNHDVEDLGLKEQTELDLEARIMGEALILNRPEDPNFGDFIELNDLNEPLELRNHDIEDLGLTIEE